MKNSLMIVFFGLLFGLLTPGYAFNKENPTLNVNLAPFIQRLSAYYCMRNNISSNCPGNFTLTETGWLNISESETNAFCKGGCFQHTQEVLQCVRHVHKTYTFENGASIDNLNDTINIGCEKGFNGTSLHSSGTTTSVSATLYALVFLALFYM